MARLDRTRQKDLVENKLKLNDWKEKTNET